MCVCVCVCVCVYTARQSTIECMRFSQSIIIGRSFFPPPFPPLPQVHQNVQDVSYHITQYHKIIAELRRKVHRLQEQLNQGGTDGEGRREEGREREKGGLERGKEEGGRERGDERGGGAKVEMAGKKERIYECFFCSCRSLYGPGNQ